MKNIFKILILILLLSGAYTYRVKLQEELAPVVGGVQGLYYSLFDSAPCTAPMPYTLDKFDTKFGISQAYFLSALSDAEAIWEKPYGKELFVYDKEATSGHDLKINLIYDYRQEATSKLSSLGIVVKDNRASYDTLRAKWQTDKADFNTKSADLTRDVAAFNTREAAYEEQVDYWNKQGGAPKTEYNKLQAEAAVLEGESKALQARQNRLNNTVEEINALATELNRLASLLNISVDKYNNVTEARGESFEEGVYTTDGFNREIDIYEFSSRAKLVRVLAHELGHALGLDHVDDPKAIMYKLNQGSNEMLTSADLDALLAKCAAK